MKKVELKIEGARHPRECHLCATVAAQTNGRENKKRLVLGGKQRLFRLKKEEESLEIADEKF